MRPILTYMERDHQHCDALFAQLETDIERREWEHAEASLQCFSGALARHLAREENVLFPAFEQATGTPAGPTSVMRLEHKYIRAIVSRVIDAVAQRDAHDFFGHADILRIMQEQHDQKEETILYVMIDRILCNRQHEIIEAMDAVNTVDVLGVVNSIA